MNQGIEEKTDGSPKEHTLMEKKEKIIQESKDTQGKDEMIQTAEERK